jgi:choloylglycine hydrolase
MHIGMVRALLLAVPLAFASHANACSTFLLDTGEELVFGQNYDWLVPDGMLFVNKRDVQKFSDAQKNPATWTSRYASITANQYGREMPTGGMNEVGLTIGLMWLADTRYESPDDRHDISNLMWIQYQLDNHATVREVLDSKARLRITAHAAVLHYLIADASGDAAVVEVLDGKIVEHHGDELPFPALTNTIYAQSLQQFEAGAPRSESTRRFSQLCTALSTATADDSTSAVPRAFSMLSDVARNDNVWRIVYDIDEGKIHLRTTANPELRTVAFKDFDLDCTDPVRMVGIDSGRGNIASLFQAYTTERNLQLLQTSVRKSEPRLGEVSPQLLQMIARLPEMFTCTK